MRTIEIEAAGEILMSLHWQSQRNLTCSSDRFEGALRAFYLLGVLSLIEYHWWLA